MNSLYSVPGMRFRYPEQWHLSEEPGDDQLTITVRPDQESTAFWSVTLLSNRPDPEQAVQAVAAAFEEEYDEIDTYPVQQTIARRPAAGSDVEFVCLELTNSAFIRAVQTERFTLLLLSQATDQELDAVQDALDLMTETLECDFEELIG